MPSSGVKGKIIICRFLDYRIRIEKLNREALNDTDQYLNTAYLYQLYLNMFLAYVESWRTSQDWRGTRRRSRRLILMAMAVSLTEMTVSIGGSTSITEMSGPSYRLRVILLQL